MGDVYLGDQIIDGDVYLDDDKTVRLRKEGDDLLVQIYTGGSTRPGQKAQQNLRHPGGRARALRGHCNTTTNRFQATGSGLTGAQP